MYDEKSESTAIQDQLIAEMSQALSVPLPPGAIDTLLVHVRLCAPGWERTLLDGSRDEAATLAASLMRMLHGTACDPPPAWWHSPLGVACARALAHDDSIAWSRRMAAAVLDVHVGTVDQLLHRGRLVRHPDGGVTRGAVLRYLLTRRPRR